jgi:hypothetical protein
MDLRQLMSNITAMRQRPNGNGTTAEGPVVDGK